MPVKSKKYVVALAGPTAVGKTSIAVDLALHFNTVILSADSRQMYRQMTIGTAKPTNEQLQTVQHYFVDTLDITDAYSAAQWADEALALLRHLFNVYDLVIVTGGSGLYFKALLDGFDEMPSVPSKIRSRWERHLSESGIEHLQQALLISDPDYHAEVDLNNPHRLIRALAFIEHTGNPFSAFRQGKKAQRDFKAARIFCNRPREELYDRINRRVDMMIAHGLLEEVLTLIKYKALQATQTVGYKELFDYLEGKYDFETAVAKIKQHTRNYAKRQITWFNNQGQWREFNPPDISAIINYIEQETARS